MIAALIPRKKTVLLLLFFCLFNLLKAQNKDTANISVTNYKLYPGTFSWRGDGQYYDMTSWDSSPYQQGHLRQGTQFRMNFRLLLPQGYDAAYTNGYPLIVMLHGAGERGNCWNDNCYCPDPAQCNPNGTPVDGTDPRFLNNDHNLVHGGSPHLSARNRAGTKLPDDPTLAANAFPGFVLFPQNTNQWRNSGSPASSDVSNAIRIVRLLTRQYNIDQDRIYIHGLSMGAQALLEALNYADWLFAAAAPMSAINFSQALEYDSVRNIPFWVFQGGQDLNPKPYETEGMIENLREKGANVRYTLYPNLGHGTWNSAYAEPEFFSWFLSHRKSNIHVDYGKPNVCATTGEGASLVLPQGFRAYQWERDGEVIPGATTNTYVATTPGVYRARYSRLSSAPADAQWNRWSDPVTVGERSPEAPEVRQLGTNILSDLNLGSVAYLKVPEGFAEYHWYQNGGTPAKELEPLPDDPSVFTHAGCTGAGACVHSGVYTLITEGYDKCPSLPSKPLTVLFGTHNTVIVPPAINGTPNNFTFELKSPTSVLLKWHDQSTNERGFEIWRRKLLGISGEDFNKGWVMAGITSEDVTMFADDGLEPATTYYYKIRAVNNSGRSNYFPGNSQGNVNHNRVVTTPAEATIPTPPGNLVATTTGLGVVRLVWETSSDDSGINQYYIYFNGDSIATGSSVTSYTVTGLPLNEEFNFKVRAEDRGRNLSAPSNPSNTHTFASGLFYKHSTGAWTKMSDMTDTWTNPEFTGWVSSFTLQERTQEDFFNFEFQGFLYINTAGTYSFRTTSDDGSQLFLNENLIVNNDGLHGNVTVTSTDQTLVAGPVPIMVRYFENTGGQSLTVQYRGPDTGNNWINIPVTALKSGNAPLAPVPPAVPSDLTATAAGMESINLSWNYSPLKVVVLGSSTAFGTGATPIENSWVNQLSTWLTGNTHGAAVVNLALGGFDTEDVLPTGDPDRNITKALSLDPDIIVVNLPSNDVANNIPLATTLANLVTLRSLAQAAGVRIFFTTTQPRNFVSQTQREMLEQGAEDIRNTFGQYVIDIYDELVNPADFTIKTTYNADGIHVNNDGHSYIFETARKKLLPYLTGFEIQRSVSADGPFIPAGRTTLASYTDADLQPDQTYYYRLRAATVDTVSQFTTVVNARTSADTEAPGQPGKPVLHRSGYSTISITWPVSTDNSGVEGYEVYVNGVLVGTSTTNAYQASDLEPETSYTFTVVAYDKSGNKSVASEALVQQTSSGTLFYTQAAATQLNDLNSWRTPSGIAPTSFSDNGQVFVIRHSLPVGNPWTVEGAASKVVVDDGVTLTIDDHDVDATLDVNGTGVLNLVNPSTPRLGKLGASTRVRYTTTQIQRADYGHLEFLSAASVYTFDEGETRVLGNFTASSGVRLKGASGNATTLEVKGNMVLPGTSDPLPSSFSIALELTGGNQSVTAAMDPGFFKLKKSGTGTVTISNSGAPFTLHVGSVSGGGLSLATGTTFQLGGNSLSVDGAGDVNTEGETGVISISGGNIFIRSTSGLASHLYFHATNNKVNQLHCEKPGEVFVHSSLQISETLKIIGSEVHADGNITLASTASVTASIEEIEEGGSISGDVHVNRYIAEVDGSIREMSASVDGVTVGDWQAYFPITGNFDGASPGPGTDPSLYVYDDPEWKPYPDAANAPPFNSAAAPLEQGMGYSARIHNVAPVVMVNTGEPFQGSIALPVSAPSGTAVNAGLNLVGNPYASAIQWNSVAWMSANINPVAAIWKTTSTGGYFEYFDATSMIGTVATGDFANGIISSGQAFWVQSIGTSPSLTITEKAKVHSETTSGTNASHLRLILKKGTITDAAIVAITSAAVDAYERAQDGVKRDNQGMFNFATLTEDGVPVAINHTADEFCAKQIMLSVRNADPGTYSISIPTLTTLASIESVKLVDQFTNTTADFGQTSEYVFSVTSDPLSYGDERFELILSRSNIDLSVSASVKAVCNEPVEITLTNTQPGASYVLFNEEGEALAAFENSTGDDLTVALDADDVTDGENTIIVKASLPGCSTAELPQSVAFTYYHAPVVTAENVSACKGEPAVLEADGSAAGLTYEWYLDGVLVPGQTGSLLTTGPVTEELYYSVRGVQPDGCKGAEVFVVVSPITLDAPTIMQEGDMIVVDVVGDSYEWFRNGVSVATTSNGEFEFPGGGSYTVTVSVGGCATSSGEFVVTAAEVSQGGLLTVHAYPNPAHNEVITLRVSSPFPDDVYVEVSDVAGRSMLSKNFERLNEITPIVLSDSERFNPGVYFIRVRQRQEALVLKIVVD